MFIHRRAGSPREPIRYRTAQGRADYEGAFRLLQRRYRDAGLTRDGSSPYRVLPFQLWDETQLIVAVNEGHVIGCVSVICDSPTKGLPIDQLYGEEVTAFRKRGYPIGEITSLATEPSGTHSASTLFIELSRLVAVYSRRVGLDRLTAIVKPRHAQVYRRILGFETIGGLRRCDHVDGRPGISVLGHLHDRSRVHARWRDFYFDDAASYASAQPRPISHEDRSYFRQYMVPHSGNFDRAAA